MRVYELAKELGISSKDFLSLLHDIGVEASSHMSVLTDDSVISVKQRLGKKGQSVKPVPVKKDEAKKESVPVKTTSDKKEERKEKKVKQEIITPKHVVSPKPVITPQQVITPKHDKMPSMPAKIPFKSEKSFKVEESFTQADPKKFIQASDEPPIGALSEDVQEILVKFDAKPTETRGQEKFTRRFNEKASGKPRRSFSRKYRKPPVVVVEPKPVTEFTVEGSMPLFEVALIMGKQSGDLILALLKTGMACNRNHVLSLENIRFLANQFGMTMHVTTVAPTATQAAKPKIEAGVTRWPIVVIMGHVDHGKTTLLDYILKMNVASREKGGITQHISAYEVKSKHGKIVFLDTPGHEAFSYLRKRGAKITDLAVLVVAADDGIMPQTIEAIKHAQEAEVPIIVAINKMDKVSPTAVETIKRQLAQHNLMSEDWGGQTICVPVSAKTGKGVDELLEMIVLQAQLMDLKTSSEKPAKAFVLETRLDKGYGPVATVICTEGTLKVGDYFICGGSTGRVRLLIDSYGNKITQAEPSIPVQVVGFNNFASMGEWFSVVSSEQYLKARAGRDAEATTASSLAQGQELQLSAAKESTAKGINLIIKTDTRGSREAIIGSLEKLIKANKDIDCPITLVSTGVGDITENDIELALGTNAQIIGFHVKAEKNAQMLAKAKEVSLQLYYIIYNLIEDLQKALEKRRIVKAVWKKSGEAVVRKVFNIKGTGVIAGCYLRDGVVTRASKVACVRDGKVFAEEKITSLQRDKKSVKEVHAGYEFGFTTDSFQDWQEDDVVYCYSEVKES